jgi:hypothetical protein
MFEFIARWLFTFYFLLFTFYFLLLKVFVTTFKSDKIEFKAYDISRLLL